MRFIIAPLIALATCALPNISYTCESDSDCEAEHICEEGACVPPKDEPKTIINTSETSQAVQVRIPLKEITETAPLRSPRPVIEIT